MAKKDKPQQSLEFTPRSPAEVAEAYLALGYELFWPKLHLSIILSETELRGLVVALQDVLPAAILG